MASLVRVTLLKKVDLPTLGRPTIATTGFIYYLFLRDLCEVLWLKQIDFFKFWKRISRKRILVKDFDLKIKFSSRLVDGKESRIQGFKGSSAFFPAI